MACAKGVHSGGGEEMAGLNLLEAVLGALVDAYGGGVSNEYRQSKVHKAHRYVRCP